jgi:hypothetical protein
MCLPKLGTTYSVQKLFKRTSYLMPMKNFIIFAVIAFAITSFAFVGCEKEDYSSSLTEQVSKKGGKGGSSTGTTSTSYRDSLFNACGMWLSDTGSWYPTVNVNNIRWRHHTSYSYDPATGAATHPYDVIVIDFDVPVIQGKTVSSYMLVANNCSGRPVCTKENGIYVSQVTAGYSYNQFWMPIGTTWLAPNTTYTGMITVITTEGCMYLSQPFTFEGPYIL